MKILLIDIPTVLMSECVRVYPPVWAAYLSAYLETEIEYFDARVEKGAMLRKHSDGEAVWYTYGLGMPDFINSIGCRQFDVIGIHVGVSTEIGIAVEVIKSIKDEFGVNIRIILGGAGIAFIQKELLGPIFRGCKICTTTLFGERLDVNLPMKNHGINVLPNHEIYGKYESIYQKINRFHSGAPIISPAGQIITSVGCEARCSFCTTRFRNRSVRSLSSVKTELEGLLQKGVRCIQFEDDNFFGWKKGEIERGVSVLQLASEMFSGIEFPNGLTIHSMLNDCFFDWVKHSLDREVKIKICFPFESASDDILRSVHKPHRHSACRKLLNKLEPLIERGLQSEVFLQIGMAMIGKQMEIILEDDESINQTVSFARELRSKGFIADIFFNSPIPGTDLFPIWRQKFPDAPWERLMLTEPSLFYNKGKRIWLKEIFKEINNSPRI